MSACAAIDSDMQVRACERMGLIIALLAGRKNVPAGIHDCMDIAVSITTSLEPRTLHMIAQDAPDEDVYTDNVWMANNCLDRIAANNIILTFADAWKIDPIDDRAFGILADRMLAALKGRNPIGLKTWRWPAERIIEAEATRRRGNVVQTDLASLEAQLLSVVHLACPIH